MPNFISQPVIQLWIIKGRNSPEYSANPKSHWGWVQRFYMFRFSRLLIVAGIFAFNVPFCSARPPSFSLKATEPLAAYTLDHPPQIEMKVSAAPEWHGFVRVELCDLLSEISSIDYVSVVSSSGGPITKIYRPQRPFGIYRLDCVLVDHRGQPRPRWRPTLV